MNFILTQSSIHLSICLILVQLTENARPQEPRSACRGCYCMLFTMIWEKYYWACNTFHFNFLRQNHRYSNATQRQKWILTGYTKATAAPQCWGSTKQQNARGSHPWLDTDLIVFLTWKKSCAAQDATGEPEPPAPCNSKTGFGFFSQLSQSGEGSSTGALPCTQHCVPGFPILWGEALPGPGTPMGASGPSAQAPAAVQGPNWCLSLGSSMSELLCCCSNCDSSGSQQALTIRLGNH